ncbi:transposase [Blastopirellula sp. JC733]|nr:transposase [Blastopirellula sediminis]
MLLVQEEKLRARLIQMARKESPIRRFLETPGVGPIWAATFYAYIDTPSRFRSKSALWRYCGLGLERRRSGNGPQQVRLAKGGNRPLKNVLIGAARTAIAQTGSPLADRYEIWTQQKGMNSKIARRNVARSIAATLWSMWKHEENYDPVKASRIEPSSSLEIR